MNTRIQVFTNVISWKWLSAQRTPLRLEGGDLIGQTVIITGANRGIGLEAAKHFSCMNVECLILACRDIATGEIAVRTVLDTEGCNAKSVSCWPLDLASFASVQSFAAKFAAEGLSLHILVCNAGVMSFKYSETCDGWEKMLQINYLSNVLLVMLLLPTFAQPPARARIIMLTSDAHYFIRRVQEVECPGILEKLNESQHCTRTINQRYFLSKLFSLFFAKELARRLGSEHLPGVVAVNPGYCNTNLDSEFKEYTIQRYLTQASDYFIARSPEMGSRNLIHAAVSEDDLNGKYLANCRVEKASDFSLSEEGLEVQKRLWDETMHLLCKLDPTINDILRDIK